MLAAIVWVFTALVEHRYGKDLFGQFVNFCVRCQAVRGYILHLTFRCNELSRFIKVEQVRNLAPVRLNVVDLAGWALHTFAAVGWGSVPTFTHCTRFLVFGRIPAALDAIWNACFNTNLWTCGVHLPFRADSKEIWWRFIYNFGISDYGFSTFI